MEGTLRKPEPLLFTGNVAENWRKFLLEFNTYIDCCTNLSEKQKAMMLLNLAGPEAMEKERSFIYKEEIKDGETIVQQKESRYVLNDIKTKFEELCTPQKNITMERYAFHTRNMLQEESFYEFLGELRIKASTCEFGELNNEMIRDRIVTGHISNTVRKQLLKEPRLSLEKAVEICTVNELTEKQMGAISNTSKTEVDAIGKKKPMKGQKTYGQKGGHQYKKPEEEKIECQACGEEHYYGRDNCPAYGHRCTECGKWNHFEEECFSKNRRPQHKRYVHMKGRMKHSVDEIATETDSDNLEFTIE